MGSSRRGVGRIASEAPVVVLVGAAGALGIAGTAMFAAARPVLGPDALFLVVDATVAVVYGATAALILSRRRHVVGYLLALTALGGGLAAAGGGWQVLAEARGLDPGAFAYTFGWAWIPGTLALFLVVPWLVRERPATGPARWAPVVGGLVAVAALVSSLTQRYGTLMMVVGVAVVGGLLTALAVEVRRRRSPEHEAVGLGWLALGTLVLALSFVPLVLPPELTPIWVTPALHLASQALFPAAILSVVLRQRLWGVEVAVSRALLGTALTLGLGALYLVLSVLLARVVPGEGWARTIATAVVVVAVQPSRLWLQRRVHRLVYGVADPTRVAGRLGSQLGRAVDPDRLLASLAEQVAGALRLESVRVLDPDGEVLASSGAPTAQPVSVELAAGSRPVGTLAATPRPGEALDPRTRTALDELSGIVATALLMRRTAADLERTRARLTEARLQERRVIRRELHDGLGPWLSGLRLGLQGVANLVETDPAAARTMIEALQRELEQRVEDVRTASRALLPPVLEELGLEPALLELVDRHAESGFTVRLRYAVPVPLPAPLAAAAYGIASEAVLNAARHSGAPGCDLVVEADATTLRLRCRDDGVGVDDDARPGVGTRSMRERAEELGGTLRLQRLVPGGTEVEAVLPLAAGAGGEVSLMEEVR